MIDKKLAATMCDYAQKAVSERLCGDGDVIAMRSKCGFVKNAAPFAELTEAK